MVTLRSLASLFAGLASVALASGACGGKPAAAPMSSDDLPDAGDGTSSDPPAPEAPAAPAGDNGPAPVSCVVNAICSETTLGGKDATDAKDRCKAAGGDGRDGACGRDDVIATCNVESKSLMMYFYKDKNAQAARGALKGGRTACTSAGGVFTPVGKPGGGGKKKPGGKKKQP